MAVKKVSLCSLCSLWQKVTKNRHGLVYLQVDNGMNFIGDFIHPRKFSRLIRLCLHVGVEAVFITPRSPWMNGSIGNFNKRFGEKFWDKEIFADLEDMRTKSTHFVDQYNALSVWKKKNKEMQPIENLRILKRAAEINLCKRRIKY